MTNPALNATVAFHQPVVSIASLFFLIIAQAELEIHTTKLQPTHLKNNTPCVLQTVRSLYGCIKTTHLVPHYETTHLSPEGNHPTLTNINMSNLMKLQRGLDNQASNQTPQVSIIDGVNHNYRTSYDGLTSEVNYFYYYFYYDPGFISLFVSELICIQIERFAKSLRKEEPPFFEIFIDGISDAVSRFIDAELKAVPSSTLIQSGVSSYIGRVREGLAVNKEIPAAPSVFTTIIPKEGLKLKFDNKIDLSLTNYQLF